MADAMRVGGGDATGDVGVEDENGDVRPRYAMH